MTHIYQARKRAIEKDQYLKDIRFLWLDNIGVSVSELRKLESEIDYIAHPKIYGKLIAYYADSQLAADICKNCPITQTKQNIVFNDFQVKKTNSYDHHRDLRRRLASKLRRPPANKTEYYFARLRYALSTDIACKNRNEVCLQTSLPIKTVSMMENNKDFIPNIIYSNILLNFYKDKSLGSKICKMCPVHIESQKIKGG